MKRVVLIMMLLGLIQSSASAEITCLELHKLDFIKVPDVTFSNAALADVVDFVRQASIDYDFGNGEGRTKGINILLIADDDQMKKPINLHLHYVSLLELVKCLCDITGLKFHIEGSVVVLSNDDGPMISRAYDVLPSVFPDAQAGGADVSKFLSRLGVPFPEGASAYYLPEIGKLVVSNTGEKFGALEGVLAVLNVVHLQIEVSCRVILLDSTVGVEQVGAQPSATNILALISQSDTLFHLTTIASASQTVSNRLSIPVSTGKSTSLSTQAQLEFCPSVSPDGQVIIMPFKASLSLPLGASQPYEYACESTVTLYNGATLLFGLPPSSDANGKGRQLAMALSVRLIDPACRLLVRHLNVTDARMIPAEQPAGKSEAASAP